MTGFEKAKTILAWTKVSITGGKYAGQTGIVSSYFQNCYFISDSESAVHVELDNCSDVRIPVLIKAKHLKPLVEQDIKMEKSAIAIDADVHARLKQLFPGRAIKINCSHSKYDGLFGAIDKDGNPLIPHSPNELISVFISHPACSGQKLWFEAQYLIPQGPDIFANSPDNADVPKKQKRKSGRRRGPYNK